MLSRLMKCSNGCEPYQLGKSKINKITKYHYREVIPKFNLKEKTFEYKIHVSMYTSNQYISLSTGTPSNMSIKTVVP